MTFYLKIDVNLPSKSNKQKTLEKPFFVGVLKATNEKSRIQIRMSVERIRRSGSIPYVTDPQYCLQQKMN
jgi:hypothetical protein